MSILDDIKVATERISRQVGYGEVPELYVTGPQAIEMYRRGILRPGDESIRLLLSPEGAWQVQEFLEKEWPMAESAQQIASRESLLSVLMGDAEEAALVRPAVSIAIDHAANNALEWAACLVESARDARDLHEIAARIRARKTEG